MIEEIIAWALLLYGFVNKESQIIMASGLFAIACNLSHIKDVIKEGER
jgi:hypothetical protein